MDGKLFRSRQKVVLLGLIEEDEWDGFPEIKLLFEKNVDLEYITSGVKKGEDVTTDPVTLSVVLSKCQSL